MGVSGLPGGLGPTYPAPPANAPTWLAGGQHASKKTFAGASDIGGSASTITLESEEPAFGARRIKHSGKMLLSCTT